MFSSCALNDIVELWVKFNVKVRCCHCGGKTSLCPTKKINSHKKARCALISHLKFKRRFCTWNEENIWLIRTRRTYVWFDDLCAVCFDNGCHSDIGICVALLVFFVFFFLFRSKGAKLLFTNKRMPISENISSFLYRGFFSACQN